MIDQPTELLNAPHTELLPLSDAIAVAQIHETNEYRSYLDARRNIDALVTRSPYTQLFFAAEELMTRLELEESERIAVAIQAAPAEAGRDEWAVRFPDLRVAQAEMSTRVGSAIRAALENLSARAGLPLPENLSISLNGLELHVHATSTERACYAFSLTCGAPYVVVTRS